MKNRVLVACIGGINIDLTARLDRLPRHHEKHPACAIKVDGGGSASNTAVWLARSGMGVRMHGWVGADPLGKFALEDLYANGVDTRYVETIPTQTPLALCLALPDDKRIITTPFLNAPWDPVDCLEDIGNAAWVHTTVCDRTFLNCARSTTANTAIPLSLDLGGGYEACFATFASHLFANFDELSCVLETNDPLTFIAQKHRDDGAVWFVTMGDRGAAIVKAGNVTAAAVAPVEPIDRTGGGDAFNAGVIAAMLSGADEQEAALRGLQLAAQAIVRLGAH